MVSQCFLCFVKPIGMATNSKGGNAIEAAPNPRPVFQRGFLEYEYSALFIFRYLNDLSIVPDLAFTEILYP